MSKLNELRHGTITDAMYHLDHTECDNTELAAALLHAFERIEQLEKMIASLRGTAAELNQRTSGLVVYGGVKS